MGAKVADQKLQFVMMELGGNAYHCSSTGCVEFGYCLDLLHVFLILFLVTANSYLLVHGIVLLCWT